jgi:putative protease
MGELVLDHNMYLWNRESYNFWQGKVAEFYLPIEENLGEWRELLHSIGRGEITAPSAMIYGRLPMMISANCVKKTTGNCRKQPDFSVLTDRYGKEFPVYADCRCCYNVIYNSVPLSLHGLFKKRERQIRNYRLDFTVEEPGEAKEIISYFKGLLKEYKEPFYKEFTTGHLKRGVE